MKSRQLVNEICLFDVIRIIFGYSCICCLLVRRTGSRCQRVCGINDLESETCFLLAFSLTSLPFQRHTGGSFAIKGVTWPNPGSSLLYLKSNCGTVDRKDPLRVLQHGSSCVAYLFSSAERQPKARGVSGQPASRRRCDSVIGLSKSTPRM